MNTNKNKLMVLLAAVATMTAACSRNGLDAETKTADEGIPEGEEVVRQVRAVMDGCDIRVLKLDGSDNKDEDAVTRTALIWDNTHYDEEWHHQVDWAEGDVVYSYAQSGIYMFNRLSSSGTEPNFNPATPHEANPMIIYRTGDRWFNAYLKGKDIGEYIGRRTQYNILFSNGIPNMQHGQFADTHISIASDYPLTDEPIQFHNMQSYLRFTLSGRDADGCVESVPIKTITIRNLVNEGRTEGNKELMAGNIELDIEVENAWLYSLVSRSNPADTMITVTPTSGNFVKDVAYYVAIPVRTYMKGLMIEFYDASGNRLSYVKTPRVVVNYNQIYDTQDILLYIVTLCRELKLKYGGIEKTAIDVLVGHTGLLEPVFTPTSATIKSLVWTSTDDSTVYVKADGSFDALKTGTATLRATTTDGTGVYAECTVTVKELTSAVAGPSGAGGYTPGTYSW